MTERHRLRLAQVAGTSFLALFTIVGLALYGLPLYYDFMVKEFGWTRTQVTSGNALSKLVVGPLFGFLAGWIVDRFGPRRMMLAGIAMAGAALTGSSSMTSLSMFYAFYLLNALGYVCGGPLPNQVLLSQWFREGRGKAMGFAYLGIGIGGALVPLLSYWMAGMWGWRGALRGPGRAGHRPGGSDGVLHEGRARETRRTRRATAVLVPLRDVFRSRRSTCWRSGSMCSIAAVGGANQHLKLFLSLDAGIRAGRRGADHLARAGIQHRRAPAHGLARRPLAQGARDAADLPARGGGHSAAVLRVVAHGASTCSRRCSASASAAST